MKNHAFVVSIVFAAIVGLTSIMKSGTFNREVSAIVSTEKSLEIGEPENLLMDKTIALAEGAMRKFLPDFFERTKFVMDEGAQKIAALSDQPAIGFSLNGNKLKKAIATSMINEALEFVFEKYHTFQSCKYESISKDVLKWFSETLEPSNGTNINTCMNDDPQGTTVAG